MRNTDIEDGMRPRDAADVAGQLALQDGAASQALAAAAARWPGWAAGYPALAQVPNGLAGLPAWLPAARPPDANAVLYALARLAARDGGDEQPAALALAFALLPGAGRLAARLRPLSERIGELVARELWIQVRGYPWTRRPDHVAANVLADAKHAVLADLGVGCHTRGAWARTVPVDPTTSALWDLDGSWTTGTTPTARLTDLLDLAQEEGVIDPGERQLLLQLAIAADGVDRTTRGSGGLFAREVTRRVAVQRRSSPSSVQRQATRALWALRRTVCTAGQPAAAGVTAHAAATRLEGRR